MSAEPQYLDILSGEIEKHLYIILCMKGIYLPTFQRSIILRANEGYKKFTQLDNLWREKLCTHSVNYFYYILPLRKRMAEGCKKKEMHKSMLCQLLNPNIFLGHFRFWNSFIVNVIEIVDTMCTHTKLVGPNI
jgi:hypothetical protein